MMEIASIHKLPSQLIDLVLAFTQYDVDVYVFMEIFLVMRVNGNIVELVLKLNK